MMVPHSPDLIWSYVLAGLCVLTCALIVWIDWRGMRRTAPHPRQCTAGWLGVLALLLLLAGLYSTRLLATRTDRQIRQHTLSQATDIAANIDPQTALALDFSASDSERPEFLMLQRQLRAYARAAGLRSLYTMGLRDGAILFGPESLDPGDPYASPPGTLYEEPSLEDFGVFATGLAITQGPVSDEYGTFISALAPVIEPRSGKVLMLVGVDIEAAAWKSSVARAKLPAQVSTLALLGLLLAGQLDLRRHARKTHTVGWFNHYLELILVAGLGISITATSVWLIAIGDRLARVDSFTYLARQQGAGIRTALRKARMGLDDLARYVRQTDPLTRERFAAFADGLIVEHAAQAWGWLPAVPADTAAAFAAAVQASMPDFPGIWQVAADGASMPAAGRPEFFPILHIVPTDPHGSVIGFDLASEPARAHALQEAAASGQARATNPLTLVRNPQLGTSLLVVQPVFTQHPAGAAGELRGFVHAVLRPQLLLQQQLDAAIPGLSSFAARLLLVDDAGLNVELAAVAPGPEPGMANLSVTLPLFLFGRTYALEIRPDPAWLAARPLRTPWVVAISGIILTGTLGLFVAFLIDNRTRLEQQVRAGIRELHAGHEKLASILRAAPAGIGVVVDRVFVDVNQAHCDMLGYRREELIGQSARLIYADEAEYERAGREKYGQITELGIGACEARLRRRDGSAFFAYMRSCPIDPHDLARGVVSTVLDINERKQAEAAARTAQARAEDLLQDAEQARRALLSILEDRQEIEDRLARQHNLLRTVIDNLPDSIYMKDAAGRKLLANKVNLHNAGVAREEEIIGKTDFDIYPRELAEQYARDDARVLREGEIIINQEEPMVRAGGEIGWQMTSKLPLRDASGNIYGLVGIGRDITAIKKKDDALRHSMAEARKLSRAVEYSPVMVMITDYDGTIEYVNPRFCEVTGYTFAEVIGHNPRFLKSGETPPDTYKQMWTALQAGREWQGEFRNRRKNGELFWETVSISCIRDEKGRITHFVAVLEDVTQRKLDDQAMRDLNTRLEVAIVEARRHAAAAAEASAAKSQFLANMSHEIRTPMNGIMGMSSLLLETKLDEDQRYYTQTVQSCSESLLNLINDILDFSKIEAGRMELDEMDFDLRALVDDLSSLLAVRAHAKNLELVCAIDPDVPIALRGDAGRLRQILTNLAHNAIKFSHEGDVLVRVSLLDQTADAALLRFMIRDQGIGIAPDKREQLFTSFYQVDASTTRSYGGTGLGLAISQKLVHMMGGAIGVESELGKGSLFWFEVRFVRHAGLDFNSPPAELRGIRTLIVDDNATNREVLRRRLESWGMQTSEAPDGPAALDELAAAIAREQPYDLAILDMQMPDMDGLTLARAIRADARFAGSMLVLMSSLGQFALPAGMHESIFAARMSKPVRHLDLHNSLQGLFAPKHASAPSALAGTDKAPPAQGAPARQARVLLAEDNLINQRVAQLVLQKLGHQVDTVTDGRAVLHALETASYDLVLMDVQMPVMDGLEATRRIRDPQSAVRDHHIPIVAMTAHAMTGDAARCRDAGMNDYLSKPVRPDTLAEVLRKWL